jgi:hypothetical protein
VAWQGWALYVPFIYWLVSTFVTVDSSTHSVSDTIYGIIPYWVAGAVVLHWIAANTSKK